MLIRTPKDWELSESSVTAESSYRLRNRREFLKTLGAGLAGAALAPHALPVRAHLYRYQRRNGQNGTGWRAGPS